MTLPDEFTEDRDTQYKLGEMYYAGEGIPQDYAKAVECWQKAADQGLADAQHKLGFMYNTGRGVPADYVKAVEWYQKAANQGYAKAQNNLGVMYANGKGVPTDYVKAVEWWEKAANQGIAEAQYVLGEVYATGRGVPKDDAIAIQWFQMTAVQGDGKVQQSAKNHLEEIFLTNQFEAIQARSNWLLAERNLKGSKMMIQFIGNTTPEMRIGMEKAFREGMGRDFDPATEFNIEVDEALCAVSEQHFVDALRKLETNWPEKCTADLIQKFEDVDLDGIHKWMPELTKEMLALKLRMRDGNEKVSS